jgi:hypothetical protein
MRVVVPLNVFSVAPTEAKATVPDDCVAGSTDTLRSQRDAAHRLRESETLLSFRHEDCKQRRNVPSESREQRARVKLDDHVEW